MTRPTRERLCGGIKTVTFYFKCLHLLKALLFRQCDGVIVVNIEKISSIICDTNCIFTFSKLPRSL